MRGSSHPSKVAQVSLTDSINRLRPVQLDQRINVLIIDHDHVIGQRIQEELMGDPRLHIVGHVGSVHKGRQFILEHAVNVMLVELNSGLEAGLELIEIVKMHHPKAEAIVISESEDEQLALAAFELGATGYVVKNDWLGHFAQAIWQVVDGGAIASPKLVRKLLHKLAHVDRDSFSVKKQTDHQLLTKREISILKMIAQGYTSPEIGRCMGISALTVSTHCKNIYRKLHVKNRAQAVNAISSLGI